MKQEVKIVSWNVNGIRACSGKGLLEFIETENPHILCLQETKAHLEQVEPLLRDLGYRQAFWSSAERRGYSGVATFSNLPILSHRKGWGQTEYDSEGRLMITDHGEFTLYNIYFPNGGSGEERHLFKQRFLGDLNKHLAPLVEQGKKIVVLGDYNVAHREVDVFDPVRLSKESGFLPEERQWMDRFFKLGFIDTFRHFHPKDTERYSWWSYRERARTNNRGWRIDLISVTENLASHMVSADIMEAVEGSDHCPIVLTLRLDPQQVESIAK